MREARKHEGSVRARGEHAQACVERARLRGEHDAGDAARIGEAAARDLGRVEHARRQQVLHAVLHLQSQIPIRAGQKRHVTDCRQQVLHAVLYLRMRAVHRSEPESTSYTYDTGWKQTALALLQRLKHEPQVI
jgi:hypothetical protein